MEEILSIINIVGVIGATIISAITLFSTKQLQKTQQQTDIMAKKRSKRIDLMREHSAKIISCGKQILYGLEKPETKTELVFAVDNFNSLLQYAYPHDVEIIDAANALCAICINDNYEKEALQDAIDRFWKLTDIYVGVEYERLKNESMGNIVKSGAVKIETDNFENLHLDLTKKQSEFISKK